MEILIAMLKIWVAIVIGYVLYKKKVMTTATNAAMSKLVVNITSPCLVFQAIATMSSEYKSDAYLLLGIGFVIYAFLGIISFAVVKLLRIEKDKLATVFCVLVFGNVGFMGLPLAESLFGNLGVFYIGILNFHFTLFAYTFGIYALTRNSEKRPKFGVSSVLNAGTVSVILAIAIYLLEIQLPEFIVQPIRFLGQITSPMAMLVLGGSMAALSLKQMFSNWKYYVVSAIRLLVFPAIGFLVMNAIWGVTPMTIMMTIYLGVPAANITLMIALSYGGDSETASSNIGLSTILSIITIPALWFFIKAVGA